MNITKERTEEIRAALQMDADAWTAGEVFSKIFAVMTDMPELKEARALFVAKLKPFAPLKPWKCPIMFCAEWSFRRP